MEVTKELKSLKQKEDISIADVIRALSKVYLDKSYREEGYSSLYSFCTKGLGYSEGGAMRRIQAAKLLSSDASLHEKLSKGVVTLCSLSEVAKIKEEETRGEVLTLLDGKSKRETEILVSQYLPVAATTKRKETVKVNHIVPPNDPLFISSLEAPPPAAELSYSVTINLSSEGMALLNEAKEYTNSFKNSEVIEKALKAFIKIKKSPSKRRAKLKVVRTRYIPKATKCAVRQRDNNQCTFVSEDGVRCCEKHHLEFDHIKPYAFGGGRDADNLRLRCRAHNMLHAEEVFGKRS